MGLYEIAGLTVQMDVTGRTLKQAAPYACRDNRPVDITLECDPRQVLAYNSQIGDLDTAQYLGTGACFARALLKNRGFQLHASAVALEGKGYLFTAPCGAGKSTHAEKWRRLFGAQCINDDKPALRLTEEGWMAWGTPWSGKHDLSSPMGVRLGAIACLQRSDRNHMELLEPERSVPMLLSQCLRQLSAEQMDAQLTLLDQLIRQVPVWLLECRDDDQAALLSRQMMTGVAR